MKLQIIIPGKRLVVDLPDDQAEARFAELAGKLIGAAPPMPQVVQTPPHGKSETPIAYYLECPHCKQRRSFTRNGLLRQYSCKACHMESKIDPGALVKLDMACGCGTKETYLTNITDTEFKVQCYICREPIKVAYNDALERFETVMA